MVTVSDRPAEVIDTKFLGLKYKKQGTWATTETKIMEIREMYSRFAGKLSREARYTLAMELKTKYQEKGMINGLRAELKQGTLLKQRTKVNRSDQMTLAVIKHNLIVMMCYLMTFDLAWFNNHV